MGRNPVVKMSGSLREDMFDWLEEWEDKVEVCLTVGTSMCGMRSDSMADECADMDDFNKNGLIIIGLQPTAKDFKCGVRIWGLLDEILVKLVHKMDPKAQVPDPLRKKEGEKWMRDHPMCSSHTPIRREYEQKKQAESV